MPTLSFFVIEDEVNEIISDLIARHDLIACVQKHNEYELYHPSNQNEKLTNLTDLYQKVALIYLLPAYQSAWLSEPSSTISPGDMGWVSIEPGFLKQYEGSRQLLMTTIQTEDKANLPFKPGNWIRHLRKRLKSSLTFGVEGVNIVYGGSHVYMDIAYSKSAFRLHQEGVQWKQSDVKNVEYFPILEANIISE